MGETKMDEGKIKEKAGKAARKICISGCFAGYTSCKKPQHVAKSNLVAPISLIGENTICPLQKYDVPYSLPKPFWEGLESQPTLDDCFWICANCDHGAVHQKEKDLVLDRPGWDTICIDCPVELTRDSIEECLAEARMS